MATRTTRAQSRRGSARPVPAPLRWDTPIGASGLPGATALGRRGGRLGIATVDVGVPQLSMHSARELCGVRDPQWLADALAAYFAG